jgi:integrase
MIPRPRSFPSPTPLPARRAATAVYRSSFYGVLVAAGMAKERTKEETGKGHSQRRTVSEISFHSLSHTATSLLKNAGVPTAVAMDIIGHESEAINRHYTHIEAAAKRSALRKLPKVL